jgi:sugar lactone lactonase YvrE
MLLSDGAEQIPWECWTPTLAGLGECPVWNSDDQSLYWIDVYGPALHRGADPVTPAQSWHLPAMPGSFALTSIPGRVLLALQSGVEVLDLTSGTCTPEVPAPYDQTRYRFNDGRCDRRGRFWVGTNRQPRSGEPRGSASYYRLDASGLARELGGATIANGLAFSPDDQTMYVADAINHRLLAYDYDIDAGKARNERVFATLDETLIPDGAAVDADGGYWSAMYDAGLIVRFAPTGQLDRVLAAPVRYPTMVAFGGADLGIMYITTARQFADADTLRDQPLSGSVFAAEVGVRGLPEPRYALTPHQPNAAH